MVERPSEGCACKSGRRLILLLWHQFMVAFFHHQPPCSHLSGPRSHRRPTRVRLRSWRHHWPVQLRAHAHHASSALPRSHCLRCRPCLRLADPVRLSALLPLQDPYRRLHQNVRFTLTTRHLQHTTRIRLYITTGRQSSAHRGARSLTSAYHHDARLMERMQTTKRKKVRTAGPILKISRTRELHLLARGRRAPRKRCCSAWSVRRRSPSPSQRQTRRARVPRIPIRSAYLSMACGRLGG